MFDTELESFKTDIDLRVYAAAQGYELSRKESWRGNAVMRHANGDKIIIKRDGDGHYVYFSVRQDSDNGTIIDFVQNRHRMSLGTVRTELRPYLGKSTSEIPVFKPLERTAKNRIVVETEYAKMQEALRHPYLENERALPAWVLESLRFAGRIRMQNVENVPYPNAVFPHFDKEGLCGYEIKNVGFTGFAKGGEKGLWISQTHSTDKRLVFCESAIDALSYAVIFQEDCTRYASIGGKPNPVQPELVLAAIARMPAHSEIVAAMDADKDGRDLVGVVRQAFEFCGRSDLTFRDHEPQGFKDWNDELKAQPKLFVPRRRQEPHVA